MSEGALQVVSKNATTQVRGRGLTFSPSCIPDKLQHQFNMQVARWFSQHFLSLYRGYRPGRRRTPDSFCWARGFECRGRRRQGPTTPDKRSFSRDSFMYDCGLHRAMEPSSPTASTAKLLRPEPHPWVFGRHHGTPVGHRLDQRGPTPGLLVLARWLCCNRYYWLVLPSWPGRSDEY